jgi:septation ring formation regulator EzrA
MPDPSPPAAWRRRLARFRPGRSTTPVEDPLAGLTSRVERQRHRLDKQRHLLDTQRLEQQTQRRILAELGREVRAAIKDLREKLVPMQRDITIRDLEHSNLRAQLATLEERLGPIEEVLSDGRLVAAEGDAAEALTVLDAVRREHEQIRVRMQIISAYEERLRRVEASVIALYDGDHRHQV